MTASKTPTSPLEHRLQAEVRSLNATVAEHGICPRANPAAWFAAGLTRRRARLLCQPCPVRTACLRAAVIEEALVIRTVGGSVHSLHGARGGLTGPARAPLVKEVLDAIADDEASRTAEAARGAA
ncbi:WhiB family transcriptional regulator [Nonomuraea fastidiosa]|uniref:WhiB family transcriptional regulator n=1 Tax=Nonomuraea fastidiosa TaxID=46173 RepID=UPI00366C4F99